MSVLNQLLTSIGKINIMFGFESEHFNSVGITGTKKFHNLVKRVNGCVGIYIDYLLKITTGKNLPFGSCCDTSNIHIGVFIVCSVCVTAPESEKNNIAAKIFILTKEIIFLRF